MSEIRLIITGDGSTTSGIIPSSHISLLMWSVSESKNYKAFWKKISSINAGLKKYYEDSIDEFPVLEGFDDGLLVINWDHHCVESFQSYQPIRRKGTMVPHNGSFMIHTAEPLEFEIDNSWSLIDHHFEETERVYNG